MKNARDMIANAENVGAAVGHKAGTSPIFDRANIDAIGYSRLYKLACCLLRREWPTASIEPGDLLHEAWLRLYKTGWRGDRHRNALFTLTMRRVLVDYWRRGSACKRFESHSLPLGENLIVSSEDPLISCMVKQAVRQCSEQQPRQARVLWMQHHFGFTASEIASRLDLSERTVKRDLRCGQAELRSKLGTTIQLHRRAA